VFPVREQFHVRECGTCSHRFAECLPSADHVGATYGDEYFFGGGAGYPDYFQEEKILRRQGARYARLLRRYVPESSHRVLDVGGACGFIADGFRAQGWTPQLLDPNPRMAAYARERLCLDAHRGTLDDLSVEQPFDVISMIQVMAHFPNLSAAMRKAAEFTRDEGFWLIETWNCNSLTARVFGRHWHEYNPPSVLHYFSARSLRTLAGRFGFVHLASGHPRKDIMWRHARALLDHQIPQPWFHSLSGVISDETVLPYPAEDLLWSIFQKTATCEEALNRA
jgi:SAM-dependent methyltransferase